ncbi:DsbA family protein [Pseudolysinimonas sp.]|uniref:DsbA family protein n=1 Tax=Pseudolysinimonas sp. TaxID=2680009 RepID=UPI003F7F5A76
MPEERLTKNQRREQARELARKEREKAQRRDRLMKILVPVIVVVVLLVAGGITAAVIIAQPKPAPVAANGPKNMISDGIVFTGQNGTITPTQTAGLKKGQDPVPAETPSSGSPVHITTYVDLSCPVCKSFEETNSAQIQDMVKAGKAVLEVKPVAILNNSYQGSQYSQRVNTAMACVANYEPDSVLPVMKQLYADQPDEQTTSGFTNNQIVSELKKAGVDDQKITSCVLGQSFTKWVTAATDRATGDRSLVQPGSQGFGTPTIVINGQLLSGNAFSQSLTSASAFKAILDSAAGA